MQVFTDSLVHLQVNRACTEDFKSSISFDHTFFLVEDGISWTDFSR